jgi:hypothetical protein
VPAKAIKLSFRKLILKSKDAARRARPFSLASLQRITAYLVGIRRGIDTPAASGLDDAISNSGPDNAVALLIPGP